MKLKPLSDHLIVKPLAAETKTASGIIIPDAGSERPERGEVMAVGPGKLLENGDRQSIEVAVGQNILFKKYAPDEVKVDGEDYLVIRAEEVMAVIE